MVALGAIQQWQPDSLSTKTWRFTDDDVVEAALSKHTEAFGELEPSDDQMSRFRDIAEGIIVR